jgi:hypothetical protein
MQEPRYPLKLATKIIDLLECEQACFSDAQVALNVAIAILPSAKLPLYNPDQADSVGAK